jgi:UDP-3-O-[3-hydroxymyristoyl] N-acetylglucosamine deacetylase
LSNRIGEPANASGSPQGRITVTHPRYRYQRTLARPAEVCGIGFVTGAMVRLRFMPASPHCGIVFVRTDQGQHASIPAAVERVTGTSRRTTLGKPPLTVQLVEHVMAALGGMRVDNCRVELNAPEPPGMDGSARAFVEAIQDAGIKLQTAEREIKSVESPVILNAKGATLALHPTQRDELRISYLLDYGTGSPIIRQSHSVVVTPESFAHELASCRTFLLESEAHELRRNGIGSNTSVKDLVVFGPTGPIENTLRFANEPARHKILDIIGDLALLGHDLRGHIVAYRSGHPLNIELARTFCMSAPQCRSILRLAA